MTMSSDFQEGYLDAVEYMCFHAISVVVGATGVVGVGVGVEDILFFLDFS